MVIVDGIHNRQTAVAAACEVISNGGIVAFPTETFYGLGVRFDDEEALRRLFSLKQRPEGKAVPLIIGSMEMLRLVANPPGALAAQIAGAFWPGPLTLLLQAREEASALITAGTGKVAVRIPGGSIALDIARALPFPVTATSANVSGRPPAVRAVEVADNFREGIDMLVDGGPTPGGRPSTIIEVVGDCVKIYREGVIPDREIMRFAGKVEPA